jgi:hypothetical protein
MMRVYLLAYLSLGSLVCVARLMVLGGLSFGRHTWWLYVVDLFFCWVENRDEIKEMRKNRVFFIVWLSREKWEKENGADIFHLSPQKFLSKLKRK